MAKPLTAIVASSPAFAAELGRLRQRTLSEPVIFPRTSPAAFAFVAAMVANHLPGKGRIWVVADALPRQERIAAELNLWTETECIFVPEREIHINNGLSDPDLAAERLEAIRELSQPTNAPQVVVVTAAGLKQPIPLFKKAQEASTMLSVGKECPPEELTALLQEHEFERVEQVTARGQWSLRGGILDVYPLQTAWPLRVEFFGDEVESIRAFDVDSQLSFKN